MTQPYLRNNISGRQFQCKVFDNPQPFLTGDAQVVDPPSTEVMKGLHRLQRNRLPIMR